MESSEVLAVAAGLLVFVLLCCGAAAVLISRTKDEGIGAPVDQPAEARPLGGGARRLAAGARRRRQAARQAQEGEEAEDEDPQAQQRVQAAGSLATRKDAYEERRRKKDEAREAQAVAEEEEAAQKEAAKQAADDAEAAKWLSQISTEKEGNEATEDAEKQGMLQAFVEYIKDRKTVVLEELAAHFSLRVQDVIDRVQNLEAMGHITGVMDDRGKFIYISREEMQAVADYIQRKGRVSIAGLAAKSNTFIDLEEKAAEGDPETLNLELDVDETSKSEDL